MCVEVNSLVRSTQGETVAFIPRNEVPLEIGIRLGPTVGSVIFRDCGDCNSCRDHAEFPGMEVLESNPQEQKSLIPQGIQYFSLFESVAIRNRSQCHQARTGDTCFQGMDGDPRLTLSTFLWNEGGLSSRSGA